MYEKKYPKGLILAARLILFASGAAFGIVSIWQTFAWYPTLVKNVGLRVVFYAVSGLVPGLVLFLSAKPVMSVILAAGDKLKGRFKNVSAFDAASVILGIAAGAMTGYLSDLIIGLFLKIIALRILLSVILAAVAGYLTALLAWSRINSEPNAAEKDEPDRSNGYMVSAAALADGKVAAICLHLLKGDVLVIKSALAANAAAAQNFERLKDAGRVRAIDAGGGPEADLLARESARRGLTVIAVNADDYAGGGALYTEDLFSGRAEKENAETRSDKNGAEKENAENVSGKSGGKSGGWEDGI
ncbi:MAG: hypothetical protein LBP26_08075 [Clostridiales bacterium]|jgi:hypothetical protein|nr:hypothetical protein [Clostridiales bacterium]